MTINHIFYFQTKSYHTHTESSFYTEKLLQKMLRYSSSIQFHTLSHRRLQDWPLIFYVTLFTAACWTSIYCAIWTLLVSLNWRYEYMWFLYFLFLYQICLFLLNWVTLHKFTSEFYSFWFNLSCPSPLVVISRGTLKDWVPYFSILMLQTDEYRKRFIN